MPRVLKEYETDYLTPDDIFTSFDWSLMDNSVFLEDADACVAQGCGMSELKDLLADVFPSHLGVTTIAKARQVLEDTMNPEAESCLEMLNRAIANAEEADELLDSYREAGINWEDLNESKKSKKGRVNEAITRKAKEKLNLLNDIVNFAYEYGENETKSLFQQAFKKVTGDDLVDALNDED